MRTLYRKLLTQTTSVKIAKPFSFSCNQMSNLIPYNCPEFAERLKIKPKFRVKLANPDTPIQKWNIPGLPKDFSMFIKRDDMTGGTTMGNKIRKLELLLADAIDKGCKHVITCGSIQSNHCSATAVACRQLGLQPHLLLRADVQNADEVSCQGNLLLDRLSGARIYMVPRASPYETHLKPRMEKLAAKIKSETGEDSYLVPVGGSNEIGLYGYINAFQEMITQGVLENFDDIVFACGSGGTAEGLSIANYLTGSHLKVHGIAVSDNKQYFHEHLNNILKVIGLDVIAEDILHIIEGYKGKGYGVSTDEEQDFILNVAHATGIMLDPVYTGKAVRGLIQELSSNPHQFNGKRILYLYTGGVYGLFDGRIDWLLKSSHAKQNQPSHQVQMWTSLDSDPT